MANVVGHFVYEKLSKNIHLKISHSCQHGMPVRFLSQFSYTSNFSFVTSIYCAKIEFICDNEKENWEPGNEARMMLNSQ